MPVWHIHYLLRSWYSPKFIELGEYFKRDYEFVKMGLLWRLPFYQGRSKAIKETEKAYKKKKKEINTKATENSKTIERARLYIDKVRIQAEYFGSKRDKEGVNSCHQALAELTFLENENKSATSLASLAPISSKINKIEQKYKSIEKNLNNENVGKAGPNRKKQPKYCSKKILQEEIRTEIIELFQEVTADLKARCSAGSYKYLAWQKLQKNLVDQNIYLVNNMIDDEIDMLNLSQIKETGSISELTASTKKIVNELAAKKISIVRTPTWYNKATSETVSANKLLEQRNPNWKYSFHRAFCFLKDKAGFNTPPTASRKTFDDSLEHLDNISFAF
ncbi:MAG: hypothetical protein GY821_09055 [Gammaproteobacteria bacterium]|nr:hypothetical protein [Gammaproteobacteria bacterium]